MLAEIGPFEVLIVAVAMFGAWVGTSVAAAKRGRWGWFLFIFLLQAPAILAFWIVNPRPIERRPRTA